MTAPTAADGPVAACPHFNPMAPRHLADPYPMYAELRRDTPVFYSPDHGLWVVTRHADVTAALKQPEIFSSVGSLQTSVTLPPSVAAVMATGLGSASLIVESDPPAHTRMRGIVNKAFTAQRIARLEPQVRAIADELIDAFVADGKADLATQFASLLPGLVICDLIGVPRADFPQLKRWSSDWLEVLSASAPEERLVACAHSFIASQRYFLAQIRARQEQPREDLLTVMLPIELGGTAQMSTEEAAYNALDIIVAGHETTSNAILNGLGLLFAHPELLDQLRRDPERIPNAVEEILRMDTSVLGLFRVTTRATELGGVTIPANARIFLLYAAANHDDAQFSDPERFDIARENAREHVAFARGIHACLGASLARLELRIALERLLTRLPNLRPAGGAAPQRLEHFFIRGYTSFPIAWDAAPNAAA
ncbi:cytochrome P450 [Sorangium sp. So ce131]|uniref:cytochrome P450 n=1 Tax=Sorangium sp. So ce131 TaxID=3133282 RepID=UPI003F6213B0